MKQEKLNDLDERIADDSIELVVDDSDGCAGDVVELPADMRAEGSASANAAVVAADFSYLATSAPKAGAKFITAIAMAAAFFVSTTYMQWSILELYSSTAGYVGLCYTLTGSMLALSCVLVRLVYPEGKPDTISRTLWFVFNCSMGSIVFGLLMFFCGVIWALEPNFLIPQLDTIPYLHEILDRLRVQQHGTPLQGIVAISLLPAWPVVALLYCLVRLVIAKIFEKRGQN